MSTKLGRMFVNLYYKYSPAVASYISKSRALKLIVQIQLLPLVALSYAILQFGSVITAVLLVLVFALPIFSILKNI